MWYLELSIVASVGTLMVLEIHPEVVVDMQGLKRP